MLRRLQTCRAKASPAQPFLSKLGPLHHDHVALARGLLSELQGAGSIPSRQRPSPLPCPLLAPSLSPMVMSLCGRDSDLYIDMSSSPDVITDQHSMLSYLCFREAPTGAYIPAPHGIRMTAIGKGAWLGITPGIKMNLKAIKIFNSWTLYGSKVIIHMI